LEYIDLLLAAILLFSAWKGYQSGLLIQLLTLLAWVIALVTAFQLMNVAVEYLSVNFQLEGSWVPVLGFLFIFLVVLLGMFLLSKWLTYVVHATLVGSLDKYAGALVGLIKAAFGLGGFLWLIDKSKLELPTSYTDEAFIYPWLVDFTPKMVSWISWIIPFSDIFSKVSEWVHIS
jgi:membrane protein required for colicin V production